MSPRCFVLMLVFLGLMLSAPVHGQDRWRTAGSEGGESFGRLLHVGDTLYGRSGPLWRSNDQGKTWRWLPDLDSLWSDQDLLIHPTDPQILALTVIDSGRQILLSQDGGETWAPMPTPTDGGTLLGFGHDGAVYAMSGVVPDATLHRSEDLGASWQQLAAEDFTSKPTVIATAQATVVFFNGVGIADYSVDGGETFQDLRSQVGGAILDPLFISPSNPRRFAFLTTDHILKISRNGGQSFNDFGTQEFIGSVRYHPRRPDQMILTSGFTLFNLKVHTSLDGGQTWTEREVLELDDDTDFWFDPCNDDVIYGRSVDRAALVRSLDNGSTWAQLDSQQAGVIEQVLSIPETCELLVRSRAGIYRVSELGTQWTRDIRGMAPGFAIGFTFDPTAPGRIYSQNAAGLQLSENGGRSWKSLENSLSGRIPYRLYVDANGGLLASDLSNYYRSQDGGATFEALNEFHAFADISPDPFDSLRAFVFTSFPGPPLWTLSTDGGSTRGSTIVIPDGEGEDQVPAYLIFDRHQENLVHAFVNETGQYARSTDSGSTFQLRGSVGEFWDFADLIYIDSDPQGTLYAFERIRGLWRSTDGGHSWTELEPFRSVFDLQIDAENPSILYVAGRAVDADIETGIWRSTDRGDSWSAWDDGLRKGRGAAIAQDPMDPSLFVTSTDLGFARRSVGSAGPCTQGDPTVLCVQQQRFEVDVQWTDFSGNTGRANLVPGGTTDSGLLYFFDPDNWEMLVKVLNGCGLNDRWWVFSSATTTVDYTLTVRDRAAGKTRHYINPLGRQSPAITDTGAFDTCDL